MNKSDRAEVKIIILSLDALCTQFEDIKELLISLQERESEKFDDLPEGLQQSDNGQKIEQAAENLQNAIDEMDNFNFDDIQSYLEGSLE